MNPTQKWLQNPIFEPILQSQSRSGSLILLVVIVGTLAILTWRGNVSGESLIFFLGTLSGSVLMLVAERIKTQQ